MAIDRVRVNEGSSKIIEFDVLDEDDEGVPSASLTTATLTLYDMDTLSIINNRVEQDVKNANNVTIDSSGHVIWTMQGDLGSPVDGDNVIVTDRRQIERHRAMFAFSWSGGAFQFECEIEVVNLRRAG